MFLLTPLSLNFFYAIPDYGCSTQSGGGSGSSGSNQSDSEVDESPRLPATPTQTPRTPPPHSPASAKGVGTAFFPAEPISEPNTSEYYKCLQWSVRILHCFSYNQNEHSLFLTTKKHIIGQKDKKSNLPRLW